MSAIREPVKMLEGSKSGTRYEACELLRVAPSLSADARAALLGATSDTDPLVAERATAALNARAATADSESETSAAVQVGNSLIPTVFMILLGLGIAGCGAIASFGLVIGDTFDVVAQQRNYLSAWLVGIGSLAFMLICFAAAAKWAAGGDRTR